MDGWVGWALACFVCSLAFCMAFVLICARFRELRGVSLSVDISKKAYNGTGEWLCSVHSVNILGAGLVYMLIHLKEVFKVEKW